MTVLSMQRLYAFFMRSDFIPSPLGVWISSSGLWFQATCHFLGVRPGDHFKTFRRVQPSYTRSLRFRPIEKYFFLGRSPFCAKWISRVSLLSPTDNVSPNLAYPTIPGRPFGTYHNWTPSLTLLGHTHTWLMVLSFRVGLLHEPLLRIQVIKTPKKTIGNPSIVSKLSVTINTVHVPEHTNHTFSYCIKTTWLNEVIKLIKLKVWLSISTHNKKITKCYNELCRISSKPCIKCAFIDTSM